MSKVSARAWQEGTEFALNTGALMQATAFAQVFDMRILRQVEREHPELFRDLPPIPEVLGLKEKMARQKGEDAMTTSGRIQDLIGSYAEGPRLLEAAVAGLSQDELHFTPGPEHWSIHENVVHVADTDMVAAVRMRYVIAQPGSTLVSFDQDKWARVLDYRSLSMNAALALLRKIRTTTTEILQRVPADGWEQVGINTEAGPQTLEWLVEHFGDHIHYHLRTIATRRAQYAQTMR